MSLNRTSIGSGQTWICRAMIPSLSNFGSSRSMIRVPFKSIVTCVPLGGDHELVPVVLLDERLGLVLGVALEDAAAALLVEQSPVAVGHVGLRARDHAVVGLRLLRNWMPELPLRNLTLALSTKSP